ncbi:MAG: efflux RND transporter periplasmic adaptor subunit [Roseiarcus sp.]
MLKDPEAKEFAPLEAPPVMRRPARLSGMLFVGLAIVAALLGGLIYNGMRERSAAEAALATETTQDAAPFVDVVHPAGDAPDQTLVLPGQTMAFIDTPIYARASGYLKSWNYDIGAHVKREDVLAQIDSPELDQQLRAAQAQLAQMQAAVTQAEANMDLAKVTSGRTSELVRQGWTSRQQGDQDRLTYAGSTAAVDVARANVRVEQAQVDRLEQLTSFERVTAPFDGLITARNTDVGALINAGAGSPATELFHMASIQTLRIFVAAPETDAPDLHPGAAATVTFDEYPGQVFQGTLARTDGAINPTSRTLLVEVDVDNADGKLLPGAYAFVQFTLQRRAHSVVIPANTLLFRSEGLRVAVVRNGVAELAPVTIGRDYGDRVEVLTGLNSTDEVIINPSDSLVSGTAVRLVKHKPGGAA